MPIVYNGINHLQSVGWSICTQLLEVVEDHWNMSREVGTLPSLDDLPLPLKPLDIETNKESRKNWKRKAATVWDTNIRSRSKRIAAMQIITTAKRYSINEFFYPHQLDFRGRVYTVPHPLTIQGSDLCRGLLQFSESLPIENTEGMKWLAIHGANSFGYDKVSFEDRVTWARDNTAHIEACANDPYTNRWWLEASDPWQFLRWTYDWVGLQNDGLDFKSYFPISLDQTCSGLQHYAALLKDPISGRSTNLIPSNSPHDIYSDVADAVTESLHNKSTDEYAKLWLAFKVDRKIVKRIVMTTPYGSKKYSHRTFIIDAINERGSHPFGDKIPEAAQWLTNLVWDVIGEVVIAARLGMDWFRDVARIIVKENKRVSWTTPLNFLVEQNYEAMKSRQIRLSLGDGSSCKATLRVPVKDSIPDIMRQINGIAPNIIHSLDASVLLMAVEFAKHSGINSIGVVHDSFSAHASNVSLLGSVIRKSFVTLYSLPVMENLKEQFQKMTTKSLPPIPTMGDLSIQEVLNSKYFAG